MIMSIENLLNQWRRRHLKPLGRITVVKSLAISKIVHLFISLPTPPKDIIHKLNNFFLNLYGKAQWLELK